MMQHFVARGTASPVRRPGSAHVLTLEGPVRIAQLADTGQIIVASPTQAPVIIGDQGQRALAPDADAGIEVPPGGGIKETGRQGGAAPGLSPSSTLVQESQKNFSRNPKTPRQAKERRKLRRVRDVAREIKLSRGCQECGYKKSSWALSFHHLHGKDCAVYLCRGMAALEREVAKCIVLCANCHAELHECESQKIFT